MDNQHTNPFKPKLGQAGNCLRMRCGRMRRGKRYLLPDAHLCVKGSLLDRFPCRNRGFSSLPTFDHLTALSKMTSGGWKEGNGEASYAVCFSPAGPLYVQPHNGQALEEDKGWGASVQPPMAARNDEPDSRGHSHSQSWGWQADPFLVFHLCQVIPVYLQNYPSSRHGEA